MTLKLSVDLRNKMLGVGNPVVKMIAADTIAFVDGGSESDTITDSGEGFVSAGFVVGDTIYIEGTSNNDTTSGFTLTGVAAGTLTVATGTLTTESAGTVFAIAAGVGGSLKNIMRNGVLHVYSSSPPSGGPTAAYTGTKLCSYTLSSGTFTAGSEENGLEFGDATDGYIEKSTTEVWSGLGLVTGTAAGFRFCANAEDTCGASEVLPRMDGTCGGSSADMEMATTTITEGKTCTIDEFKLTMPEYYGA